MIDLHCHLLSGIDDGPKNLSESIALAKMSYDSGISHVVCTPHIHEGYFDNHIDNIEKTHRVFVAELAKAGIPLKSHFAAEVRISPNIVALFNNKSLPFIGYLDGNPVLLLELPHSHIPPGSEQLIYWLKAHGVIPMVAHPERNRDILANYNKAAWLKGKGVLFQLTAGAITGTFGYKVQDCALKMLRDGFADIVATDTHNVHKRPPELAGAFQHLRDEFGSDMSQDLCINKPREIAEYWFRD